MHDYDAIKADLAVLEAKIRPLLKEYKVLKKNYNRVCQELASNTGDLKAVTNMVTLILRNIMAHRNDLAHANAEIKTTEEHLGDFQSIIKILVINFAKDVGYENKDYDFQLDVWKGTTMYQAKRDVLVKIDRLNSTLEIVTARRNQIKKLFDGEVEKWKIQKRLKSEVELRVAKLTVLQNEESIKINRALHVLNQLKEEYINYTSQKRVVSMYRKSDDPAEYADQIVEVEYITINLRKKTSKYRMIKYSRNVKNNVISWSKIKSLDTLLHVELQTFLLYNQEEPQTTTSMTSPELAVKFLSFVKPITDQQRLRMLNLLYDKFIRSNNKFPDSVYHSELFSSLY